ncbi:MAG: SGNH/GDSL hydrolase family protein [Labilithrix sp.]|nr:SGNH/GDSL hydrolase family protein [Labilithrix sp.]
MRLAPALAALTISFIACGGAATPDEAPHGDAPPGATSPPEVAPAPSPTPAPTTETPGPTPEPALTAATCFKTLTGTIPGPDYDKFKPTIAKSCAGTQHQKISGVEKLVFLGDSVTTGTPPTLPNDFYRSRVGGEVRKRFGAGVEIADCSAWGARTDDYLEGKNQIASCFPSGGDAKKTLVVMTMGGNDIAAWAKSKLSTAQATAEADIAADRLRAAIDWLKEPARFPKGVYVVFANVYEYTDTSGDLLSCPAAALSGLSGTWPEGAPAVVHFQERFMEIATQTKTDMIFLLEHFCGHGYKRGDATLQCYRGPGAELWFDATCTHPNPKGHKEIAGLFTKIIDGL